QPLNQICSTAAWNSTFKIVAGTTSSWGTASNLLNTPHDVTFDGYGNMYVVDYGNHRIQRFPSGSTSSTSGVTVAGFSTSGGSGYSQLLYPTSMFIDRNETMYILDSSNCRVVRWLSGEPLGFTVAAGHGYGSTLDKIGTSYAIYLDDQSNIYISDHSNHRVTKWFNGNHTTGATIAGNNVVGSTPYQLNSPWGIYVDANYTLYIADYGNHRIQKWIAGAMNATTVAGVSGVLGSWSYQLYYPTAITFDQYTYMYIMDSGNNMSYALVINEWMIRIQRWWLGSTYGVTVVSASLYNPRGMAFDTSGNLVVADQSYHRVVSFPVSCREYKRLHSLCAFQAVYSFSYITLIFEILAATTTTTTPPSTNSPNQVCGTAVWNSTFKVVAGTTSSWGTASNRLNTPHDVTFDGYDNMYVVDYGNHRIQRFPSGSTSSTSGVTVAGFSTSGGSGYSQLLYPTSMFIDCNETMYILDSSNYRVVRWLSGEPLGFTVAAGHGYGSTLDKIGTSYAIYLDDQSNIYISDNSNHRVTKWFNGNHTTGVMVCIIETETF
ncbi:unnamed protein product, partial [Rotaria sp. Silwood1]